jgi:nucleoside-diphosphate-sugar epimerase
MDIKELYQQMLKPSQALLKDIANLEGDIVILGAGGKMGPALAKLTKQAIDLAGVKKSVIAVSRFSEVTLQRELELAGIETIAADLLEENELQSLPDVANVLYLAGTKFGTTGRESFTWAMNTYLPGRVAEKYKNSRIVVFSTGNVYPFTPVSSGGATEADTPMPVGEYAQSCLGRERIFQHFSLKYGTPILIYRLNYANDVSYGVLVEIAKSVRDGKPIDLRMGHVNVIWQNDANEIAIRCLQHCASPAKILNVTGMQTLSVRRLAEDFGVLFDKPPIFQNREEENALLSNASECSRLFGQGVTLRQMMSVISEWLKAGGKLINKPTHFQERTGQF